MQITSQANHHLKLARRVRDGREPTLLFVEGPRLVNECVEAGLTLTAAFLRDWSDKRLQQLVLGLRRRDCPIYELDPGLIETLSDTVNSQGIILLAKRPIANLQQVLAGRAHRHPALVAAFDRVQDPGNAGTMIRTAEAAGATGVVASLGTVDPFAPKSLRASMGSAFRIPIAVAISLDSILSLCHEHGLTVVGTVGDGGVVYTEYDWRAPTLVVFGNEALGVSPDLLARCDLQVRIPLASPVESLNVAAAAAVTLFEAARQRR